MALAAMTAIAVVTGQSVAQAMDKITLAVTDIEGLEALQTEFGPFRDALASATGLEVEFFPVSSRTAAVEGMTAGQADFVLTGPAEYVVIRELTKSRIVVGWQRPDYYGQIVVMAKGPIRSPEDLRGKTVAFGSIGSTSQQLGPAQSLADLGLAYNVDYTAQIIKRNVAVEALIRGDIAGVGMNRTHLEKVREAYPDEAFSVIARGRDLPNDLLVARAEVPEEIVEKVRKAFVEQGPALMAAVLQGDDNKKYTGGTFITDLADRDYD
ncbi:MAG: PhnD/SsuA/transferrin family substrate-binding protein [Rhizobiales bacterium]|nr:PhnD/SsuA/transferrin family substrate-binding protein [Hyphomicrobiales bacterium]